MKKYFFLLCLVSGISLASENPIPENYFKRFYGKCDACGCSGSGGGMGFSSMLGSKYVGIRYMQQRYQSRDGIFANSPWAKETFNTFQLWTKIPIGKRFQIVGLLPIHAHERQRVSGDENISGIGDVTVLAYYSIARTKTDSLEWKHHLQIGGGVKAPTGKYDIANNAGSVNPSFQIGTGAWDFLLASEYVINRKNAGLQLMANYIVKSENDKNYRFGNQFNYGATVFYLFDAEHFKLMPQAGIAGENYAANEQYGLEVANTAGNILFSKFGLESRKGKFSVGLNAMLPISQDLNGGLVEAKARWGLNLNYSL